MTRPVVVRGDARRLPLPDASVDLIVTSPPYFALRDYRDGDASLAGQIGSEPTPADYIAALVECTREWARVLKPGGSMFVNLGDAYSGAGPGRQGATGQRADRASADEPHKASRGQRARRGRVEQFTREDAAWLAGVIDSDGSIGIKLNLQPEGRAPSFVPWVRVGQVRPEVVHRIAELVGTGKVMQDGRGVWNWSAAAQQARWVLERIHPWLLIKKRQAWAAVEVARHVEDRNAKGSWRPLTPDDVAYRKRLREAVLAWNQGRDDDMPVPAPPAVPLPLYPLAPREKSLRDLPHAYAAECVGRLGLIKRAEICWNKSNGLPESTTDRVRRSHEFWFHLVKQPRYFAAVDEIREAHVRPLTAEQMRRNAQGPNNSMIHGTSRGRARGDAPPSEGGEFTGSNPLGKLPGSVWTVATEPLQVPAGIDDSHFAAYPTEWPRRLILGWSPSGICTACGEGRRPVTTGENVVRATRSEESQAFAAQGAEQGRSGFTRDVRWMGERRTTITGYACACTPYTDHPGTGESSGPAYGRTMMAAGTYQHSDEPYGYRLGTRPKVGPWREYHFDRWTPAPTRPSVILDPFGGTGTTAHVAAALGRIGITVDLSAGYSSKLAASPELYDRRRRKVLGLDPPKPQPQVAGQLGFFDDEGVSA